MQMPYKLYAIIAFTLVMFALSLKEFKKTLIVTLIVPQLNSPLVPTLTADHSLQIKF